MHSTLRTEIVTDLMTEGEVSKRLNLSVALLRRRPRGSRGVVLHDRFDQCSSNRHGQRPIGGRAEKSSYCMPPMAFLGIRNQQGAGSTLRLPSLLQNISGYLCSSRRALLGYEKERLVRFTRIPPADWPRATESQSSGRLHRLCLLSAAGLGGLLHRRLRRDGMGLRRGLRKRAT
jgi:hypothetical protein